MTHFWYGVIGVAVAFVGAVFLVLNRQIVSATPAALLRPVAEIKMFQPGAHGRVPVLTAISTCWVLIGLVLIWLALTGQPLPS